MYSPPFRIIGNVVRCGLVIGAMCVCGSSAQAGPLDAPIGEIQTRLAEALRCGWKLPGHNRPDDSTSIYCDGPTQRYELNIKNGGLVFLEQNYINPDYRHSKRVNAFDREYVYVMVETMLPDWQDARRWLAPRLARSERGHEYQASIEVAGAKVVVYHQGVNISETGATYVTITRIPALNGR